MKVSDCQPSIIDNKPSTIYHQPLVETCYTSPYQKPLPVIDTGFRYKRYMKVSDCQPSTINHLP